MKQIHFAGVNTRPLAEATKGQDVLVSYADVKKSPAFWTWMRPLVAGGHFRHVILDSGAFTELSQRKLGKVFKVSIDEYAAFAAEHQDLFTWVANLDDIEGDTVQSNANLQTLQDAGVRNVVPVYHEGEDVEQLAYCIDAARAGRGILAVGCQRPKGSLIPRNVVKFLGWLFTELDNRGANDLTVHGFGLTRYASSACPCNGPARGFPFDTTDTTTWIAEGCALERSGAMGRGIAARHEALAATVTSYQGIKFNGVQVDSSLPKWRGRMNTAAAYQAGGQAKTVARRFERDIMLATGQGVS